MTKTAAAKTAAAKTAARAIDRGKTAGDCLPPVPAPGLWSRSGPAAKDPHVNPVSHTAGEHGCQVRDRFRKRRGDHPGRRSRELGSGKTVFVKGMAKGLCVPDWDLVCSPTFTITSRYRGRLELLHVDAWRLRGESDIADLGFEEWVSERGVTAVEWAGRVRGLLPGGRLEVVFEHVDTGTRRITFNGVGSSGFRLVEEVKKNVSTGVRG